jgi:hypothetical protein
MLPTSAAFGGNGDNLMLSMKTTNEDSALFIKKQTTSSKKIRKTSKESSSKMKAVPTLIQKNLSQNNNILDDAQAGKKSVGSVLSKKKITTTPVEATMPSTSTAPAQPVTTETLPSEKSSGNRRQSQRIR